MRVFLFYLFCHCERSVAIANYVGSNVRRETQCSRLLRYASNDILGDLSAHDNNNLIHIRQIHILLKVLHVGIHHIFKHGV